MNEILVAVLSAVGGLFLFRFLVQSRVDKGQAELQVKVDKLEDQAAESIKYIAEHDKAAQEKVDAISKEQDKPISQSELVDWFNKPR